MKADQNQKHKSRVERYHGRNADRGLSQTKIWVPTHQVEEIKAIAEKMRADHAKKSQ